MADAAPASSSTKTRPSATPAPPSGAPAQRSADRAPKPVEPKQVAAPRAPFYTAADVSYAPRVASRVQAQLPAPVRKQRINDVVVVRLLVSETGHPSRISLLRRSKSGPALDKAVVAAVSQWTFAPARKNGEAVSCWYNVGVPIDQNGSIR